MIAAGQLGLAPGDVDDAMRSKKVYVRSRISKLSLDQLRGLGIAVERDHPLVALSEALDKLNETGTPELGEVARRRIIKLFDRDHQLEGDLSMVGFIEPIWPALDKTVTSPGGWGQVTLKGQIERHADLNQDWSGADVLHQLGAVTWSRARFFRLIEAAVHPRTRDDDKGRASLIAEINRHLEPDGWVLKPTGKTSGLPVYTVQPTTPAGEHPADAGITAVLASFDRDGVHAAWEEALALRAEKPEAAITAARTLVETVCKHILAHDPAGSYDEKDDLPKLYRATAKSLKLAPDQHSAEAFRMVLGGCFSVVEGLGTLRNKLGNAHGKGPEQARPQVRPKPRHAELAVNLAGAMAMFLVSTWVDRRSVDVGKAAPEDEVSKP